MSSTLDKILNLIKKREVKISYHGYEELMEDDILVREVIEGAFDAAVIENYPNFYKGPSILVLQHDIKGNPIHVVWGIAKNTASPAVLITAYRPDPKRWSSNFLERIK